MEESEGDVAGIKSATVKVSATTPTATCAPKPASTAWSARARSTPTPAATPASPRCSSSRKSTTRSRSQINPADVRTDTYRASGAGGQHINKTDSAVRLTHVPTGIVVQCQNDRSQHRNRDEAWQMLRARLYEFELRKQQAEQQKLEDAKSDIGWGHQIRSYVLDQSPHQGPAHQLRRSATPRPCSTATSMPFIEASLKQGV